MLSVSHLLELVLDSGELVSLGVNLNFCGGW